MIRICLALSITCLLLTDASIADNKPEKELVQQRYELMASHIGSLQFKSAAFEIAAHPEVEPIYRYTDPARGYVGGAIWVVGASGRPAVIVDTELHPNFANKFGSRIVFEMLAVAEQELSMTGPMSWTPRSSGVTWSELPVKESPAATPQLRTLQLRQLAKRFAANETVGKEVCELRLLPQPIYRYRLDEDEAAEGAIFILAYGQNPEILLFLEPHGDHWQVGAGRLSGARSMVLTFDSASVWSAGAVNWQSSEPYTATNRSVKIPGFDRQGNPATEETDGAPPVQP
ncbi:MAG: hypothetical protein ACK5Q5_11210 [Planctomycetaceae bacterium]